MKRRDFLKKLGIVCGAAIACPAALLKGRPKVFMISLPWKAYHNGGCFKTEAEYKKFLEKFRMAFKATKFKPPIFSRFEKEFWTQSKKGSNIGIDWFIGRNINETPH